MNEAPNAKAPGSLARGDKVLISYQLESAPIHINVRKIPLVYEEFVRCARLAITDPDVVKIGISETDVSALSDAWLKSVPRAMVINEALSYFTACARSLAIEGMMQSPMLLLSQVTTGCDLSNPVDFFEYDPWLDETSKLLEQYSVAMLRKVYNGEACPADLLLAIAAGERGAVSNGKRTLFIASESSSVFYEDVGTMAAGYYSMHVPHYMNIERQNPTCWNSAVYRPRLLGYFLTNAAGGWAYQSLSFLAGCLDASRVIDKRTMISDIDDILGRIMRGFEAKVSLERIDACFTIGNRNLRKKPIMDFAWMNKPQQTLFRTLQDVIPRILGDDVVDMIRMLEDPAATTGDDALKARAAASVMACHSFIVQTGFDVDPAVLSQLPQYRTDDQHNRRPVEWDDDKPVRQEFQRRGWDKRLLDIGDDSTVQREDPSIYGAIFGELKKFKLI